MLFETIRRPANRDDLAARENALSSIVERNSGESSALVRAAARLL